VFFRGLSAPRAKETQRRRQLSKSVAAVSKKADRTAYSLYDVYTAYTEPLYVVPISLCLMKTGPDRGVYG